MIRAATISDLPSLIVLEELAESGWTPGQLEREFSVPVSRIRVFEKEGQIVGHLIIWSLPDELQVVTLAVHPGHRRQGIARKLLLSFLKEATGFCTLEVREKNSTARYFYENLGFRVVGSRPCYYQNPEDNAILMEKKL